MQKTLGLLVVHLHCPDHVSSGITSWVTKWAVQGFFFFLELLIHILAHEFFPSPWSRTLLCPFHQAKFQPYFKVPFKFHLIHTFFSDTSRHITTFFSLSHVPPTERMALSVTELGGNPTWVHSSTTDYVGLNCDPPKIYIHPEIQSEALFRNRVF